MSNVSDSDATDILYDLIKNSVCADDEEPKFEETLNKNNAQNVASENKNKDDINVDEGENVIQFDFTKNSSAGDNQTAAPNKILEELKFNFLDNAQNITSENKPSNSQDEGKVKDAIDFSDEEDQTYSTYGRDIKSLLKKDTFDKSNEKRFNCARSSTTFDFGNAIKHQANIKPVTGTNILTSKDVYSDPFFGLRIINPLVSATYLKTHMNGKIPVTISKVKQHLTSTKMESDWVIAGVLTNKSMTKRSQKGSTYAIWKIGDLSENSNTISLFMFSDAYTAFWKTTVGTVIGVLNPNVLESRDNGDQATLSIDNSQKIMILGTSKDMGMCRALKKNGEPCNNIVNISRCEFCIYHVKQEYKKCSRRSELQAFSNTQKFSIDMLKKKDQRKPLDNSMPVFNAVYAVKNEQLEAKNAKRLALLSGTCKKTEVSNGAISLNDFKKKSERTELEGQQTKKDFLEMKKSRGWRAAVLMQESSKSCDAKQNNMGKKELGTLSSLSLSPRLGAGCTGGTINLLEPITKKHIKNAKSNAIKWVQKNGKIKAKDPNKLRLNKEEKMEMNKKRPREEEHCEEQKAKKSKALVDKFKQMMEAKSAHTDLIEKSYDNEKEKYFNKLEMKERIENKMLSTYKVPCKAVKCLICKYTSFSASEICKEQKHPLRVTDATKRFFKCADCGNRTVSLDRMPSHSCKKCSSSSWTRAAMMDERKLNIPAASLSIRGDEESYIGAVTKDANLNLLVPDNDET